MKSHSACRAYTVNFRLYFKSFRKIGYDIFVILISMVKLIMKICFNVFCWAMLAKALRTEVANQSCVGANVKTSKI